MMMIGEGNRMNPTVSIPPSPWSLYDNNIQSVEMENLMSSSSPLPVSGVFNGNANGENGEYSQFFIAEALNALHRYLPSNEVLDEDSDDRESDIPIDAYSCDEFRMYEFKVRRCARGRSHDWTECPYAHPGEKARRRDPRKFHYSGTACPDFRKGNCKRGDSCEYAHGVFECWLHPARYRTQPCKDGTSCRRRVCFFAHTPDQLRVLSQQSPRMMAESPPSYDGSPLRHALDSYYSNKVSSPNSTLFTPPISPPSESPPMSPSSQMLSRSVGANPMNPMNDIVASLRHLQLNKTKSSPPLRGVQIAPGFGSPSPRAISSLRPVFSSLPNTPTQTVTRSGISKLNFWDSVESLEEEPVMDRVESGKELRSRMYEKLSKENSLDRVDSPAAAPDVGWISELVN